MSQSLKIFPKIIKIQKIKIKSHAYYWLVWDFNNNCLGYCSTRSKRFSNNVEKAGSWIGTVKKYINNIQTEVSNIDIEENNIKKKENNKKENNDA